MLTAPQRWVEGVAPERVPAAHLTAASWTSTRPLCSYPQIAKYAGSGSTDDEANFVCVVSEQALIAQTHAALPATLARPLAEEARRP